MLAADRTVHYSFYFHCLCSHGLCLIAFIYTDSYIYSLVLARVVRLGTFALFSHALLLRDLQTNLVGSQVAIVAARINVFFFFWSVWV